MLLTELCRKFLSWSDWQAGCDVSYQVERTNHDRGFIILCFLHRLRSSLAPRYCLLARYDRVGSISKWPEYRGNPIFHDPISETQWKRRFVSLCAFVESRNNSFGHGKGFSYSNFGNVDRKRGSKCGTEDRGNLAVVVSRAIFEKDSSLLQQPLETSSIFPISNPQGGTKIPPSTIP